MTAAPRPINALASVRPENLAEYLASASEPLVFKGLTSDWPVIAERDRVFDYLQGFYTGEPVNTALGDDDNQGDIFYNAAMDGFSYTRQRMSFGDFHRRLRQLNDQQSRRACYMDSAPVDIYFPGFGEANSLTWPFSPPRVSLWAGNRTRVSAHFDVPDNLACVIAGRRRFVLFPPEQSSNLYVGPWDFNPAGPAISLANPNEPDDERFPRFREALAAARVAELEAGDALFIPSLWWHQVEGLDDINLMVNYWWTTTPEYVGNPMDAFLHALMNIRSLPPAQRQAWKNLFDNYIFATDDRATEHIPPGRLGILGEMTEPLARRLRTQLLNRLNR